MGTIAIIPARGGSKRIMRKNLVVVHGKTLLEWTVADALAAPEIDAVVVTSEDNEILGLASRWVGVIPHHRPPKLAESDASIEDVITDALTNVIADTVVLMNCCCPIRQPNTIGGALKMHEHLQACCIFSACEWAGLTWQYWSDGLKPNYDVKKRPRSQDWDAVIRETGSFWVFGADHIQKHGAMLCEKARPFMTHILDSFDIDTTEDLETVRQILPLRRVV